MITIKNEDYDELLRKSQLLDMFARILIREAVLSYDKKSLASIARDGTMILDMIQICGIPRLEAMWDERFMDVLDESEKRHGKEAIKDESADKR